MTVAGYSKTAPAIAAVTGATCATVVTAIGCDVFAHDNGPRAEQLAHYVFFFQAEDGIRDLTVTGVQTCALPIYHQAHQVVNQREDNELFEDPVDRFALQHIEAHGGFQMGKIGFNTPPGPVELG